MLGILSTFLAVTLIISCVAAIPVAVVYYKGKHSFTATAEVKVAAEEAYRAALRVVERNSDLKIEKKDDKKFLIDVERKDGKGKGSFKATSIGKKKTQLIVVSDAGKEKGMDEALSLQILENVCKELKIKYTLIN